MAGRAGKGDGGMKLLLAVAAAAPLLVAVAMFGAQFGLLDKTFAFDVLTMTVGRYLALAGVGAAALAVVQALRDGRKRALFAAAAVVLAGGTLAAFLIQQARLGADAPTDVASDLAEPPGYSRQIEARRAADGAVAPVGRLVLMLSTDLSSRKGCRSAAMVGIQLPRNTSMSLFFSDW